MRTAPAARAAVALVAFGLAAGCSTGPTLAPVTGTVTMNGKPLRNVKVAFHPDPDKKTEGLGSTGTTDDAGAFTLTYDDGRPGAVVGHHRVILTDLDPFGNVVVGRGDYRTENPRGPKETPMRPRFSDTYSTLSRTPIQVEVKPGMSPVTVEVKK